MNIGVDAIDTGNQILFSILNRARALSEKGCDPSIFGSILADLYGYTIHHFEREEAVMEACGCPDLESHKQAHSVFKGKVDQLLSEPSFEGNTDMLAVLLDLLENWLVDHIMETDKAFGTWAEGKHGSIEKALQKLAEAKK